MTANFSGKIKECKVELGKLRSKTDEASLQRFKTVKQKLFSILDQKEVFWRQRSKQFWLNAGDKNSHFFMHLLLRGRGLIRFRSYRIQQANGLNGMMVCQT